MARFFTDSPDLTIHSDNLSLERGHEVSIARDPLCLLVSGCAALRTSVLGSDATSELAVPAVHSTDTPRQSQAISGLLDVFQGPVLDDLVGHALDENLDIRFAAQQPEEARFAADAQLGNLRPNLLGGLSVSRERDDLGDATETYSPTLDVSWEVLSSVSP